MRRIRADKQIQTAAGLAYLLKSDGTGEFQNFAPGADGEVLTVTAVGDLVYRLPVTIGASSTSFLAYNATTGELDITALGITNVTTSTEPNLAGVVANEYTAGTEFQEGDVVIVTADGTAYMHNGGAAGDATDFTQITAPGTTDAAIRALFSATNGISYNATTGAFVGVIDPAANNDLTLTGAGFLVDVSASDVTDTNNLVPGSTGGTTVVTLQEVIDNLVLGHPPVLSGTTVPTFVAATHPEGTTFAHQNVDGITIANYISDGTAFVKTDLVRNRIVVPPVAFAGEPTIAELRTWIDANVSDEDKTNSILVLENSTIDFGATATTNMTGMGGADHALSSIRITDNGTVTTFPVNIPTRAGGVDVFVPEDFIRNLRVSLKTLGYDISDLNIITNSFAAGTFTFEFQNGATTTPMAITVERDSGAAASVGTTSSGVATTREEIPLRVWDLNADNITQIEALGDFTTDVIDTNNLVAGSTGGNSVVTLQDLLDALVPAESLPTTAAAGDYLYFDGADWVKATKVEQEFIDVTAAATTVTLSGTPIPILKVIGYSNGLREGDVTGDVTGTTWTLPFAANGTDDFEAVFYTA